MILLQSTSRYLLQILSTRLHNLEKGVELDCQWIEFDDVRYHIQANVKNPNLLFLSVSIPTPPPETTIVNGLPPGAIEAIKATYGVVFQILDPPRDGFNLTVKLSFSKLPADEEHKQALLVKISSIREVVLGAPLRAILKQLSSRTARSDLNQLVSLVHRPNEAFFVFPQAEKVTLIFPMHFRDSVDTVLATSFLQEFVEARRTPGLSNAPPCLWSLSPPQELQRDCSEALSANAGFVSFASSSRLLLNFTKEQPKKRNYAGLKMRASSSEDCNTEECAPEKEVGKVSVEWVAGDKTKVVGTFPPRSRGWTGYVEKDTAGQTNIYSVEPAVYVAESAISSGTAGSSADGSGNTVGIVVGVALVFIAAASSILFLVGKNQPPPVQTPDSSLTYYIDKLRLK
ncbi:actin-related protein 2/3 complex subunit 2A-like [Dorcoceras hygrometricum]|nr:actin-related protein 2/3 complex subunit 2A-like [Dorcoceras hygrometricum]